MSTPYIVVDTNTEVIDSFESKEDAIEFSKNSAQRVACPRYVYKLVADVVAETRTVIEVIDHE